MRSDRALLAALLLAACTEEPKAEAPSASRGRFEGVKAPSRAAAAASGFCDVTFPAEGEGARRYEAPPSKAPPAGKAPDDAARGWRWVNVWATWCEPCKDEMPLLGRWHDAAAAEGFGFELELLSIDAPEAGPALAKAIEKGLPAPVRWLRSEEDFPAYLTALGVGQGAAIPIHALVDPGGMLRCVRVGAIHDRDYGAVKGMLQAR